MDRQKRRTNLKKLQAASNADSKKLRSTSVPKTSSANKDTKISEFFTTPNKPKNIEESSNIPLTIDLDELKDPEEPIENDKKLVLDDDKNVERRPTRAKRTKLTNFVYKNKEEMLERLSMNDFETMDKQVKKAPKLKPQKPRAKAASKKQQTIKSAFLRNEQIFSEIAAQHCIAENFSPDEMQLALAMSKSEAESQGIACVENENNTVDLLDGDKDEESIRRKLQRYGFRTAKNEDYRSIAALIIPGCSRRAKTKWANKFTALTLRNPEYQQKKLTEKIEKFLQKQSQFEKRFDFSDESIISLLPYRFLSKGLKKVFIEDNRRKVVFAENKTNVEEALDRYFVKDLFPVSDIKAGYLLKNWKAIQGRDVSPQKRNSKMFERIKYLESLYQELEAMFASSLQQEEESTQPENSIEKKSPGKNCLWFGEQEEPQNDQNLESIREEEISFEKQDNNPTGDKKNETNELDAMIELIETLPEDKENSIRQANKSSIYLEHFKSPDKCKKPPDKCKSPNPNDPNVLIKSPLNKRLKLSEDVEENLSLKQPANLNVTFIKEVAGEIEEDHQLGCLPEIVLSNQFKEQFISMSLKLSGETPSEKHIDSFAEAAPQQQRAHSPDIFADSDEEEDEIETKHGITTYEIYSSDEVKTSSKVNLNSSPNIADTNNSSIPRNSFPTAESSEVDPLVVCQLPKNHPNLMENSINSADLDISLKSKSQPNEVFDLTEETPPTNTSCFEDLNEVEDEGGEEDANIFNECISLNSSTLSAVLSSDELKTKGQNEVLDLTQESPTLNAYESPTVEQHADEQVNDVSITEVDVENSVNIDDDLIRNIANEPPVIDCYSTLNTCAQSERKALKSVRYSQQGLSASQSLLKDSNQRYTLDKRKSISMNDFDLDCQMTGDAPAYNSSPKKQNRSLLDSAEMSSCYSNLSANLIDLTQCESEETRKSKYSVNVFKSPLKLPVCTSDERKSKSPLPRRSLARNISSNSLRSEQSIDLTQEEERENEDTDDDDDCIMLSDDEINYSIWKANESHCSNDQATNELYSQSEDTEDEQSHSLSSKHSSTSCKEGNNYSFLELLQTEDDLAQTSKRRKSSLNSRKLSRFGTDFNLNDEDDQEPVCNDYLISPEEQEEILEKSFTSNAHKEREAFGILESCSESLNLSQLESVQLIPEPVEFENELNNWMGTSFFQSPKEEAIVPIKRKTDRFDRLLRNLSNDEDLDSDLHCGDEFDLLVSNGLQMDEKKARVKTPTDFDQLLTAEISFNASTSRDIRKELNSKTTQLSTSKSVNASHLNKSKSFKDYGSLAFNSETRKSHLHHQSSPNLKANSVSQHEKLNYETPQDITVKGRTYTVRITKEAKPDYTTFSDAELLKRLHGFGIKPLKRKQAIKLLEYIYNQTHPVLAPLPSTNPITQSPTAANIDTCMGNQDKDVQLSNQSIDLDNEKTNDKKMNLKDAFGKEILRFKDELMAKLVDDDEEYILQTNISKKTPQPLLPFHIAWHNLLCSNVNLHESVVMYEAIDLQEIYLFLKSLGYRYDPKDMRTFFDRRCIIFRYDLTPSTKQSSGSSRQVRAPKTIGKRTKVASSLI